MPGSRQQQYTTNQSIVINCRWNLVAQQTHHAAAAATDDDDQVNSTSSADTSDSTGDSEDAHHLQVDFDEPWCSWEKIGMSKV